MKAPRAALRTFRINMSPALTGSQNCRLCTKSSGRAQELEIIASVLNIKQLSDWYSVTWRELEPVISKHGVDIQRGSLLTRLRQAYPDFRWNPTLFAADSKATPRGHWQNTSNLIKALDRAGAQLGITKPDDWYAVHMSDLEELGFPQDVPRTRFVELLEAKHPEITWDRAKLLRRRYAQQSLLGRAIPLLFPDSEIKTNVRTEVGIVNPASGHFLELDIFIPSLSLALEYHERHHYISTDLTFSPVEVYRQRDQLKQQLAQEKGITLIVIPCWWDRSLKSLAETIRQIRPDLLKDYPIDKDAKAIPAEMPKDFAEKNVVHIEGIGEPMNAGLFTDSSIEPSGWWMFEKYDGIRAFWNPEQKCFFSKKGNKLVLPQDVVESMPSDIYLDGEFWFGRDNFQEATKVANKALPSNIDWTKFKYMVFDIPNRKGTYEEAYRILEEHFEKNSNWKPSKYIAVVNKEVCRDVQHLDTFFQNVIDSGGEGVIMRDPASPWTPGRSLGYLKHKKYRDAEAKVVRVVGHQEWECELPNGVRFVAPAGTKEFANRWNPKVGDIITFKHRGFLLGNNKPKFPTLYRLRDDMGWEDVVQNWKEHKTKPLGLSMLKENSTYKPKGYWRDLENRKRFFTELAEENGFDPLDAKKWRKVSRTVIAQKKGATLLFMYKTLSNALENTFPELKGKLSDEGTAHRTPTSVNRESSRQFLSEFASEAGFNPTDTNAWQSVSLAQLCGKEGGSAILRRHTSLQHLLLYAFPELLQEQRVPIGGERQPQLSAEEEGRH